MITLPVVLDKQSNAHYILPVRRTSSEIRIDCHAFPACQEERFGLIVDTAGQKFNQPQGFSY
jgi:hypothetical protein